MARAILRALLLAAALVACAAQNPGTLNNCPNATTLQFFDSAPSQFPATIDCTTTTQYAVYQYWSPPVINWPGPTNPDPTNPDNPSVLLSTINTNVFLADGSVAPGVVTTTQFGPSPNPGTGGPPVTDPVVSSGVRSCSATLVSSPAGAAQTWTLAPYATTFILASDNPATAPINTRALCCQQCSADPACRSWRYIPSTILGFTIPTTPVTVIPPGARTICSLYSVYSNGTSGTVADNTDYGVSAGYGTLSIRLGGTLPPNLDSVTTTFGVAYNQICGAGNLARAVNGTDTITFTPIANAPTASVANVTAPGVCVNATTINGSFVYSGSFTSGSTNFTVLVDGATCSPGASPISGNQTSASVSFSCTGLSPLAVGAHNISVSASYGGVGGARCTGGTTAAVAGNLNVQAAPTAALAASSAASVCTGSQNIIATFTYAAGAVASSTFAATIAPYVGATCTPVRMAGTPNDTVTVTCTAPFPGFPVGTQTVTLTATYTGVAPCSTVTQTVSANATATVAAAGSGIALTPIATSSVCSPVNSVGAAWTYTATNIGATTFVATSPGLSCAASPATQPGSTGTVGPVNVTVVCSNAGGPVAAGSVPITLTANYDGNAPCPGSAINGTSSVTVLPQPTGSLTPRAADNPVRTCFGIKAFSAQFVASLTGTATSWAATSATLAGLFPCNVSQTGSASGDFAAATCTAPTDAGYPTGTHTLAVSGTFAAAAPCSGGALSGGTTQVIVAPAPVVTVTPRTPVAGCNGAANVSVDFDYNVTGAGTSPDLSLTVPTGCTAPVPSAGVSGTIRVTCTGPFSADVPVSLTISATEQQPPGLCGSGSGSGATVVPILCCSPPGTTSYAKLNSGDYNDPVCWRHQKPGNSQWSPCGPAQFAFGWMNQGQTGDTTPSTFEAMSNTQDPTCPSFGAIGTIEAKCATLDGITGVGANGRAGNIMRISVSNFAASTVPTMRVYAMCQPPRNRTCYASSGSLWRNPLTWPRYRPVTTSNVPSPAGDLRTTTFNIPMATYFAAPSGGCTCDTIYWFVEQVGTYRYRPAAGATCPWTLP